ncbi:pelota, partial [Striga asiatica]
GSVVICGEHGSLSFICPLSLLLRPPPLAFHPYSSIRVTNPKPEHLRAVVRKPLSRKIKRRERKKMKIVRRDLVPRGPGSVKMVPEEADDLWVSYNLIAEGDTVVAITVRKVLREAASGGRDAERVKLKLEIKVEAVEYDKEGSALRIRGKNVLENEHVKIGAFHTLEIELHRPFVLRKELWDSLALDMIRQVSDPKASADLAVILMQEGLAHILLVGKSVTTTRSRIETSIPRKHGPAIAGYDKALNKFFDNVLQAFLKHIDFNVVRCAVIASPGFTKDQFHKHLLLEAERKQLRPVIENKSRIILVHTTSGYKHSLKEVLDDPSVMNMIKDTKAAQEVRALKDFFAMLSNDPERACYGPRHVEVAHERMAVQTLLITDELFRSSDIPTRQKYVDLVDSVKASGGTVHIFSSMHVSGEQLAQLTGVAAILRFPLPDLEDIEM